MNAIKLDLMNRIVESAQRKTGVEWPKPKKFLAAGVNGVVYETGNGRLIKAVYDNAPQEYEALHNLRNTGIVPKFNRKYAHIFKLNPENSTVIRQVLFPNETRVSNHLTVFVMEKVGNNRGMTLSKYVKTYPHSPREIQNFVHTGLIKMHVHGISHGDLHAKNIIVTVDPNGRIDHMWIIDFGRSKKMQMGETEREMISRLPVMRLHNTRYLFDPSEGANIPLHEGGHRANVHMAKIHYGINAFNRELENLIRKERLKK